jgi:hypothetical protein
MEVAPPRRSIRLKQHIQKKQNCLKIPGASSTGNLLRDSREGKGGRSRSRQNQSQKIKPYNQSRKSQRTRQHFFFNTNLVSEREQK